MSEIVEKSDVVSLGDLFTGEGTYVVPIYQRAYAWGRDEIDTLLSDISNARKQGSPAYYLGSLVLHEDNRDGKTVCTVIDGQQRLTTLYLLFSYLKNRNSEDQPSVAMDSWNMTLEFDCRDQYTRALQQLRRRNADTPAQKGDAVAQSLYDGYDRIHQYFEQNIGDDSAEYCNYLKNNVKLVRDFLPAKTDLNHYFEIMNTRGQQLEAHEIVKARLMSQLNKKSDREAFSQIWDACADMDHYVQANVATDMRERWFGGDWCSPEKLTSQDLFGTASATDGEDSGEEYHELKSIEDILGEISEHNESETTDIRKVSEVEDHPSRYRPIIDFPNFLLQILSVYMHRKHGDVADGASGGQNEVSLDDQRLLNNFDTYLINDANEDCVREFAAELLLGRFLFDNYIIKSSADDGQNDYDWILKKYKKTVDSKRNASYVLVNSFGADDGDVETAETSSQRNPSTQNNIVMLQSMFQVTESGRTYKNALQEMLQWLFKQVCDEHAIVIGDEAFQRDLQEYAQKRLRSVLGLDESSGPEESVQRIRETVNRGVKTNHFIFNYLDYALWNMLAGPENVASSEICEKVRVEFDELKERIRKEGVERGKPLDVSAFRFRYRDSVEHFYPQNPVVGEGSATKNKNEPSPEDKDSFGNLCLMSTQENSLRNNLLPPAKVKEFDIASQSLKFQFMAGETLLKKWEKDEIEDATNKWVKLLKELAIQPDNRQP